MGLGIDKVKGLRDRNFLETQISLGSGLLRNLNLTGWPKGWVVIPSLSVMKGYNRHMNRFPKITLSVIFLTRTNVVLKYVLSWHTYALGILNSICIFPPLAEVNLSLVFLKYLEGMIPSWMQLRSAPESIKAMTSNSKIFANDNLDFGMPFLEVNPIDGLKELHTGFFLNHICCRIDYFIFIIRRVLK